MSYSEDTVRKTSAVTLSDMEMFIFPELIYSLLLANIMSPRLWAWRDDPWFAGLERMKPYRRITRLKQFIMDHYTFNLDLDTWGLTTQAQEIDRFKEFIDRDTLAQSNALFGYEGDKYYFDIDIRTHFGLDKVGNDVIPYWKTETVEAMDAFRHKDNYSGGAGECVSLAALYGAALFIVARIPLKDIYLMATPLHSQNFIDVNDGVLTNNRRLVTKNMWFNGTALSAQARRALENEKVTLIAHESGCIHTIYDEASIDPQAYAHFGSILAAFLSAPLSSEMLGNFLRHHRDMHRCFQFRWPLHGVDHYLPLERIFEYEDGSPFRITDHTREKLLVEVDAEEFQCSPLGGRVVVNDLEDFITTHNISLEDPGDVASLKERFCSDCLNAEVAIEALLRFCHTRPQLPNAPAKTPAPPAQPLNLDLEMEREEIIDRLLAIRDENPMADMAFYAYRDLARTEPDPFLIAAIQRNTVITRATEALSLDETAARLKSFVDASIYDEPTRLAQPDEVWNFAHGDGLEKAIALATVWRHKGESDGMALTIEGGKATLSAKGQSYAFDTSKDLDGCTWAVPAAATGRG